MRRFAITLVAMTMGFTASAHALAPTSAMGGYGMSASVTYQQLPNGSWEYGYDVYAEREWWSIYYDFLTMEMDFGNGGTAEDHILNMYDPGGGAAKELRDFWTVNGNVGNNGGDGFSRPIFTGVQASYGDLATNTWITAPTALQADTQNWGYDATYIANNEGMANPFHSPSDYAVWYWNTDYYEGTGDYAYGLFAGKQGTYAGSHGGGYTAGDDDLLFDMSWYMGGHVYNAYDGPQLVATIRLVSDLGPYGEMNFKLSAMGVSGIGPLLGPAVKPIAPGDLDGLDGVNDVDIDLMGAFIRNGTLYDATFDLSSPGEAGVKDGLVTLADLDYLVRYLVETSAVNGDGDPLFGTQYGDFNLDGEIELGDLTRLGTYYGVGSTWAQGNANPHLDTNIELGDLTILGTYYGASNGGVDAIPEPMTMSLLAVGACLPLFRRKRR